MLANLLMLLRALPELLKLYRMLKKRINEAEIDREVAHDVRTIHDALSTKDPKKLDDLFNS